MMPSVMANEWGLGAPVLAPKYWQRCHLGTTWRIYAEQKYSNWNSAVLAGFSSVCASRRFWYGQHHSNMDEQHHSGELSAGSEERQCWDRHKAANREAAHHRF